MDTTFTPPQTKPPLTLVEALRDIAIIIVLAAVIIGGVVVAHQVLPPIA